MPTCLNINQLCMIENSISLSETINNLLRQNGIVVSTIFGEILAALAFFSLTLIIGFIVYYFFEHYLTKWAEKTSTTLDDELIRGIKLPIYAFIILVGALMAVAQLSSLNPYGIQVNQIFYVAETLLVIFIIARIIRIFFTWSAQRVTKKHKVVMDDRILKVLIRFLQAIAIILGIVYILHVFNVNLTGIIVGLGIGGIAVALALQNILSDLFSAFTIFFDRPFVIGDYIVVGPYGGTVTKVGLKSTRIQLLAGEEMIISNHEVSAEKIRNLQKMPKRRVEFNIHVAPEVGLDKLKKIPLILKETVEDCKQTCFDMVHLREVDPVGYIFEVVYYINSGDYKQFLDIHDKVLYAITERFKKEGIEFGFSAKTNQQTT